MKIIQILPTYAYGDAIGNEVAAIDKAMYSAGYESLVYAENIDGRRESKNVYKIKANDNNIKFNDEDVIIYHLSTGSELNYSVCKFGGKLIIRYHNITPAEFYEKYDKVAADRCAEGRDGMAFLAGKADYCIADSEFNKQELIEAGYKCEIDVVPILLALDDYKNKPDAGVIKRLRDGKTNILFAGRVAPNKKHEDLIRVFYNYKKNYNNNARLILLGNHLGYESYYYGLDRYARKLGLTSEDIVFTGHISFKEVLGYYHSADMFLCMSEHEGFCVPIVEAMYFGIPIVARNTTAVPDTLGDAGIVVDEKDFLLTAGVMDYILKNDSVREELVANGKRRLEDFDNTKVLSQMMECINKVINK